MTRVAINGLGRIGRATLKILMDKPELELVAVNDIVPAENIEYLLKYDSAYGRYARPVSLDNDNLVIGAQRLAFFHEKNPAKIPWGNMGVDIVFECTGLFTNREDAGQHIQAGAKYVIISAPAKDEAVPTVVHGVNHAPDDARIISCASCTTNCITPVVEIMGRRIGIEKAIMTTVHGYTASQSIVDGPSKKTRRGRAAAANLIPTSTGAAIATTKALPEYDGQFDGVAVRTPVIVGSIADIVFVTERNTSVDEVNSIFREEARSPRYDGVLGVTDDPLTSTDIIGDARASVVDMDMTQVVGGNLVKVMSWYDNEWGYSSQMVRQAAEIADAIRRMPA